MYMHKSNEGTLAANKMAKNHLKKCPKVLKSTANDVVGCGLERAVIASTGPELGV